jgi:hypothetical protein
MPLEMRNAYKILVGKFRKRPLERLGIDGKIILKLICQKWVVEVWTGFCWLKIGSIDDLL